VAVGWQGLLRNLPRGGVVTRLAPAPSPLIARAGVVVLSTEDLDPSTSVADLVTIVEAPVTLVITDGAAGGTIWDIQPARGPRARRYPAVPSGAVVDATGAGDSFMAALVAARLGHPLAGSGRHGADVRLAAAVASLTIEAPGLHGVPGLAAIADRLRRSLGSAQPAKVADSGGPAGGDPDRDPG
jgi:sugar/nucleoside kinase (ribokinase family)